MPTLPYASLREAAPYCVPAGTGQRGRPSYGIMAAVDLTGAVLLGLLALMTLYASWTFWLHVGRDWAMALRGVTVPATVVEVIQGPGGDGGVHWALITFVRSDGTLFNGRIRGWSRNRFSVGDQVEVRYDPSERLPPRWADRWLWKAAASSLSAHIVYLLLAVGMLLAGIGVIARVAVDFRL
jgi:Protein of unknown function (DUF3592)